MIKKLIKLSLSLATIIAIIIVYLSFFGISTKQFNNVIKSEILDINKTVRLELNSVKFKLNPSNFSINATTFEPDIFVNSSKLELEYIKTNVSIKSFINQNFSIDDLEISTKKNKLNDLILLARAFKNTPELFILNNVIKEGFLVADIKLNFDNNGKIKNDYEINGFIKNGKIDILRKYFIKDLNLIFNIKDKEYIAEDIQVNFNDLRLLLPNVKIKEKNNQFLVDGKLISKKNNIDVKLLNNLLKLSFKENSIEKIELNTDNNFNFILNKKFKISNFNLESRIDLIELIYKNNLLNIKKYIPSFRNNTELINHKILVNYEKNKLDINGSGNIKIADKTESLNYKIKKQKDQYFFETNIDINKNLLLVETLQYKKKEDLNSNLKINGIYKKNGKIEINRISFNENNNNFLIEDLKLNSNFKVTGVKKIKLNYVNNNNIKNHINIKKNNKKYEVYGKSIDLSNLIDKIFDREDHKNSSSLFKNFNSDLNIKIDKTYIDKNTFVNNLAGSIKFKKNKIDKLNLDSVFPNNKKLTLTVNTTKNNEKITTLFTDYPKPLIKRYKFVKGFEEGALNFYSIKKNDISNSTLIIDNFKVQEIPILAKLLTLASLQGIADLLTGEGIRFTDLEMKFSNEKKLMKIKEMYAIGPAISILMEGYIQDKELVSLRGTLVPATTINRTISSIPFIGKILVGKKVGEGVFGVSFKVKGPPKDLKTTVNPIKTLTPRFITRTLEKIKKN